MNRAPLDEELDLLDWCTRLLCVDAGRLVLSLHDPVACIEKWADKIAWVDCKDVKSSMSDEPAKRQPMGDIVPHFTSLGSGAVNFEGIVAALGRAGCDSWLVVEQDASPDPYATFEASWQHLKSVMRFSE